MSRIAIDMSPLIHGSRAVVRCTAGVVRELLAHDDIECDLLYFDHKRQTDKHLRIPGKHINETTVPVPYRLLIPAWRILSWPCVERFCPECELLYTQESYFPPGKAVPVLATVHGIASRVIPEKIPAGIVKALDRSLAFLLKHADYLVAVSETTRTELVEYAGVPQERIFVVTHGVDAHFRRQGDRDALQSRLKTAFGMDSPYILFVGAIGTHKNVMGILQAYECAGVKSSHRLVLAGPADSAWDDARAFVSAHNLSDRVRFPGYVNQAGNALADLYNGADLFVFPSFYEGWTSPPLEAMACGTPVITSNCSSLPETVGDAAIRVDPNDPRQLAAEMERVLGDNALRSELTDRGLKHAASHTWKNSADKLARVFADVRSRGPCKGKR